MQQSDVTQINERISALLSSPEFEKLLAGTNLHQELSQLLSQLRSQLLDQMGLFKRLTSISIALSREKNTHDLLERILTSARKLSQADAGTLYLLDFENRTLNFAIVQNETMGLYLRRDKSRMERFQPVPLEIDGLPNHSNVSTHAAISGNKINITDVYQARGYDFSGTRKYDESSGYRSRSMLVIPMQNHEQEIIGVLQLINARHPETGDARSFCVEDEEIVGALASQAAVVLTKTQLIQDLENLLNAFIQSIATAIDNKSPHTGRHVHRVVDLALMIAGEINNSQEEPFAGISFTQDEITELRIASWLHDVGKIATPEHILDKRTRLESIWDKEELIRTRFALIAQHMENRCLRGNTSFPGESGAGHEQLQESLWNHWQDLDFVLQCNRSTRPLEDEDIQRLEEIASREYTINQEKTACLTPEELRCLCVKRGNLTPEERQAIENHALATQKILAELPFPRKHARVAEYAAKHHERPDGSGYPFGLSDEHVPLQARILAVADVFEALTAKDRPYKKPVPLDKALEILKSMKKDRHLDPDVVDLFIHSRIYAQYEARHLDDKK